VVIVIFNAVAQGKELQCVKLSSYLLLAIQVVSCIFMFDACRRIIMVTKKRRELKVNVKSIVIHVLSYVLYLVSVVYFMFAALMKTPRFELAQIMKSGFSSLSQICICAVFWNINKMSLVS